MEPQDALTRIGFTEYEAKVYLALLRDHPATGYQISKTSGVPRSMVYETLSRLHARGAVMETVEERATLYRPLPPEILLDRHQQTLHQLLGDLRSVLENLYTATEEDSVWAISGFSSVTGYALQLIREAQQELFLVLTDEDVNALQEAVTAACERGIRVSVLLTGEAELDCGEVMRHPPLESELQGLTGTLLVVADSAELLIGSRNREMTGTITRNANLVLIARQFVWMELFTQRVYARLGEDLLQRLDPPDRQIFESLGE